MNEPDLSHQCYKCLHFYFSPGEAGYGEWTPGSDMSITCWKDHWPTISNQQNTLAEVRAAFDQGPTCPDWQADPS